MTVRLNPYINFRNNAREALAFYHSVFGGELHLSTYAEGGMPRAACRMIRPRRRRSCMGSSTRPMA